MNVRACYIECERLRLTKILWLEQAILACMLNRYGQLVLLFPLSTPMLIRIAS